MCTFEWQAAYVDYDVAEKCEGLIAWVSGHAVLAVAHLQRARFVSALQCQARTALSVGKSTYIVRASLFVRLDGLAFTSNRSWRSHSVVIVERREPGWCVGWCVCFLIERVPRVPIGVNGIVRADQVEGRLHSAIHVVV